MNFSTFLGLCESVNSSGLVIVRGTWGAIWQLAAEQKSRG